MKINGLSLFGIKKYINKSHSGFTIVELLVVIVVIGILVTLSIVSYTGITQRAAAVTLKSDIKNSSTQLALYHTTNDTYPLDLAAATTANVLPKSTDTTYQYTLTSGNYCLSATSTKAGSTAYHFSSLTGTIEDGVCDGHDALGVAVTTTTNAEILVVAGGGGGGSAYGGGGGAGGVTSSVVTINTGYESVINVGSGGAGGLNCYSGKKGSNSSGFGFTTEGGGGGAAYCDRINMDGGSGGGGGGDNVGRGTGGIPIIGQGNMGGIGVTSGAGGGGGAGGVGIDSAASGIGGAGGIGYLFYGIYYAGGGGGASYNGTAGNGGLGGGGSGGNSTAGLNGIANTGSGGGGGGGGASWPGGSGGSGIVIIRYLTGSMTATGGTKATSGAYTIYTFTVSDTFAVD